MGQDPFVWDFSHRGGILLIDCDGMKMYRSFVLIFVLFSFLQDRLSLEGKEILAVFYPTSISVSNREAALNSDYALKAFDVMVFGKFREFKKSIKRAKVKYFLAAGPFAKYSKLCIPFAQFTMNKKTRYKFQILSTKKKDAIGDYRIRVVGIVEQLGGHDSRKLVSEVLGMKVKSIKRASTVQDLVALLLLESVDLILVKKADLKKAKERFPVKLVHLGDSNAIRTPVLCSGKRDEAKAKQLINISSKTMKALGFDGIKPLL